MNRGISKGISKGISDRIEELENQVKSLLWCCKWDLQRLQDLTDRVETIEAVEKDRKNHEDVAGSIPADGSNISLETQPESSEPTQCTRTHVCGTEDPCNGYARTESWAKFYVLLTDAEKDRWENSYLTAEAIYNQRPKPQSSTTYGSTSTAQFQSNSAECISIDPGLGGSGGEMSPEVSEPAGMGVPSRLLVYLL